MDSFSMSPLLLDACEWNAFLPASVRSSSPKDSVLLDESVALDAFSSYGEVRLQRSEDLSPPGVPSCFNADSMQPMHGDAAERISAPHFTALSKASGWAAPLLSRGMVASAQVEASASYDNDGMSFDNAPLITESCNMGSGHDTRSNMGPSLPQPTWSAFAQQPQTVQRYVVCSSRAQHEAQQRNVRPRWQCTTGMASQPQPATTGPRRQPLPFTLKPSPSFSSVTVFNADLNGPAGKNTIDVSLSSYLPHVSLPESTNQQFNSMLAQLEMEGVKQHPECYLEVPASTSTSSLLADTISVPPPETCIPIRTMHSPASASDLSSCDTLQISPKKSAMMDTAEPAFALSQLHHQELPSSQPLIFRQPITTGGDLLPAPGSPAAPLPTSRSSSFDRVSSVSASATTCNLVTNASGNDTRSMQRMASVAQPVTTQPGTTWIDMEQIYDVAAPWIKPRASNDSGATQAGKQSTTSSPVKKMDSKTANNNNSNGQKKRSRQDIAVLAVKADGSAGVRKPSKRMSCWNCGVHSTPQWRCGPDGPRTLCNACGVRYKKGLPLAYWEAKVKAGLVPAEATTAEKQSDVSAMQETAN